MTMTPPNMMASTMPSYHTFADGEAPAGEHRILDMPEPPICDTATEIDPATIGAGTALASLGFTVVTQTVSAFSSGGLTITRPAGQIGVLMPNKPNHRWNWVRRSMLVIDHQWTHRLGMDYVNVKLRCNISYNGPEVLASFSFDPGGRRSRMMRDTTIAINNPLPLRASVASAEFRRLGIEYFPSIEIPIEFRIDHPWPASNREETFSLVLSGNKGFGSDTHPPIIRRRLAHT